ncbi:hypothetical protein EST38_g158 [Candolleomyces aberdarensis]|uniref:Bromo domain-containing protein n=1 Tax=Candolleomyces aberdarensis TaxID=2316362 RepID=A0A4Q2E0T4_9AGAR|nr:hypothetical protein EST38_g158 [Candolleomyces aberdarensis]
MNNLLRTLTESRVKPTSDLKLLLTAVKETRRQSYDAKLSDAFYESLENLLADLRTITIDNRDAEAFLKPVSKAEVPDYYDIITNPMDFSTMAKKLKNKQYKSKREFKDDLDLIWSNCYKYNAEDHPLRPCVDRLKVKAERLLKYITDRKDRTDPQIPFDLAPPQPGIARPRMNGNLHRRTPSTIPPLPVASSSSRKLDLPFADTPALIRTPEGMVAFRELDRGLLSDSPSRATLDRLKHITPFAETELDSEPDDGVATGDKRKMPAAEGGRPRKRARFAALPDDLSQLWWNAVQTDALMANGLPEIPYASSSQLKPKRQKRQKPVERTPPSAKSMLGVMNNNIKTMRRVRQTHAKLASLAASTAQPDDPDAPEGGLGGPSTSLGGIGGLAGGIQPPTSDEDLQDDKIDERHWADIVRGSKKGKLRIDEERANGCIRWVGEKILEHAGFQGTSRSALDVFSGVFMEYLLNVGRNIRYLTDKYSQTMTPEEIMLHTLFESGVSQVQELDKFVSDDIERHGGRMMELEKKLAGAYREATAGQEALEDEGLFEEEDEEEAGALAIGDFAEALGEDYLGLRELGIADEFGLNTLSVPKSLLKRKKAQKLAVTKPVEKPLDYPLPPPVPKFTYSQVEDQIGLLKTFYQFRFHQRAAARMPPAPPQPSAPLFNLPGPSLPGPSLPNLPGPNIPGSAPASAAYPPNPYPSAGLPTPAAQPGQPTPPPAPQASSLVPPVLIVPPDFELPDDAAPQVQAKMGPLGQITKPSSHAASSSKKKKPAGEDGAGAGGGYQHPPSAGPGPGGYGAPPGPGGFVQGYGGSGGGGGGQGATFIPTIVGPNGLPAQLGPDGSPKKGGGYYNNSKKGASGGTGAGPGRKKKEPPPGLVIPMSTASSQASSNGVGGYPSAQGQVSATTPFSSAVVTA